MDQQRVDLNDAFVTLTRLYYAREKDEFYGYEEEEDGSGGDAAALSIARAPLAEAPFARISPRGTTKQSFSPSLVF